MSETTPCIIHAPANAGPLEAKPPIIVSGKLYTYSYGQTVDLPEAAIEAARNSHLNVEVLSRSEGLDDDASPAPVSDSGNGDGAADGPGGASGGADSPLDHDGDGEAGGSLPHEPPALTRKTKRELLAIAEAEGVAVNEDMTVKVITEAIEAARVLKD